MGITKEAKKEQKDYVKKYHQGIPNLIKKQKHFTHSYIIIKLMKDRTLEEQERMKKTPQ